MDTGLPQPVVEVETKQIYDLFFNDLELDGIVLVVTVGTCIGIVHVETHYRFLSVSHVELVIEGVDSWLTLWGCRPCNPDISHFYFILFHDKYCNDRTTCKYGYRCMLSSLVIGVSFLSGGYYQQGRARGVITDFH